MIVLKKQPNESAMPEFVQGNLTARIKYDVKNALGIGRASFYLPELSNTEWEERYKQYGFWRGKGYLRADSIESDRVSVSIYDKSLKRVSRVNLEKGQTSSEVYIPGFDYCQGGVRLRLDSLKAPDTRVRLKVNADVIEVAKGERFLDNKCQVREIESQGLVQRVKIRCMEDERPRTFELKIEPSVTLKIGENKPRDYSVGDIIYEFGEDNEKRIFLGYIGETPDDKAFIVPVVSTARTKEEFLDSFAYEQLPIFVRTILFARNKGILTQVIGGILSGAGSYIGTLTSFIATGSYPMGIYYQGKFGLNNVDFISILASSPSVTLDFISGLEFPKIEFVDFALPQDIEIKDKKIQEYYQNAIKDYESIVEGYSKEKYENLELGEEALYNNIILARDLGQKRTMVELCQEFKKRYPDSEKDLSYCEKDYKLSNTESSTEYVLINGKNKKISFEDIYEPSLEDYSVEISIKNAGNYSGIKILGKNQEIYVSEKESIALKKLGEDYAVFDISNIDQGVFKEGTAKSENLRINFGDYRIVGKNKYKIRVKEINLKKVAKISLIPAINKAGTEAKFGFRIDIEKRWNVTLMPEEVEKRIERLNASISTWKNISNFLGKTIEVGKKVCLGAGAYFTAKNFLGDLAGEGIARQRVMRGKNGWYERCTDLVNKGEYTSIEKCFLDKSEEIDKEVKEYNKIIKEQNEEIKKLQEDFIKGGFLEEKAVDTDKFMESYSEKVVGFLQKEFSEGIMNPENPEEFISISKIKSILSYDSWKNNGYDLEQLRDIELYARKLKENPADETAKGRLYSLLSDIQIDLGNFVERKSFLEKYGFEEGFYGSTEKLEEIPFTNIKTFGEVKNNFNIDNEITIDDNSYVYPFKDKLNGKEYLIVLDNDYVVTQTYLINSGTLSAAKEGDINPLRIGFKKYDKNTYENKFKNPEVRYYENEPYKGFPAIVPFDLKRGWYIATKQTLPIGNNIRTFDASGRVNSFYLCNVGENGIGEFYSGVGDDICEGINFGTGQPYNQFPGLKKQEASKLVGCAVNAIEQASRQHTSGVSEIRIRTSCGGSININVGKPALDIPDIQCQDFMSPKECQLLYNVCDPVICPSSRCDFGGAYPVQDVVQSGIIGSIALCLPNFVGFGGDVAVPVCLTGINAGIEGWVSVLSSYRDCLQNNLNSGGAIGICDEIHSIYACEFFWRQAAPLAQVAIPKIAGALLKQNVRGGGEYLSVQNAFDNAKKSANYFTQYYAANSYKAFKLRETQELGGVFCKNFISAVVPKSVEIIDTISKPDSPPQFHGRFDEIPFTSVTVPPISHYKVFYHVYAGKDSGAYYKVYLRSGSESSFYQDTATTRIVASGYVPIGEYASETKDFTAPSGYKELCINVNGQEECGFKEVSTSFAVNYVKNKYLTEIVAKDVKIKTEEDCVSGTIIGGEFGKQEIYDRGIIRVCATDNPGKGTDFNAETENSRWVEVGYCGNEKLKCWLDTKSVKDVIKFEGMEKEALEKVTENYLDILRKEGGYLFEKELADKFTEIDKEDSDKKIQIINKIIDKVFFSNQKAYLLLLRGNAYRELAVRGFKELIKPTCEKSGGKCKGVCDAKEFSLSEKGLCEGNKKCCIPKEEVIGTGDIFERCEQRVETGEFTNITECVKKILETESKIRELTPKEKKLLGGYIKTYKIDRIGFEKDGEEIFDKDVKKYEDDEVKLVVEYEYNCEDVEYRVFSPRSDDGGVIANVWKTILDFFTGGELIASFDDKSYVDGIIKRLGKGKYYVVGYCFDNKGRANLTKSNNLIVKELAGGVDGLPSPELRYGPFKGLFEKYARKNLPSGWSKNEFKALLVAIAVRQSNLGYPSPELVYDPRWIMEYGWSRGERMEKYKCEEEKPAGEMDKKRMLECAEKQIEDASLTLKNAWEGEDLEQDSPYNRECGNKRESKTSQGVDESFLRCILSVYFTGNRDKQIFWIKEKGTIYAEETIEIMKSWEEYFNSH